jgi:DNA-binding transcriptional LysR family regulator
MGERMLDPRRLQMLRAVVDTGSIKAAAAVLGYTPSAVSQSISALEREAKTPLFERVGRGIRPTQAGVVLAEHAAAIGAQLEDAERALEALRSGAAGILRIAAFTTAGTSLVPRALATFRDAHPGVELDLAIAETDEALAQLRSDHRDLVVIAEHSPIDDAADDLLYAHLLEDQYRLVLPRSHPAAKRKTVPLEHMADEQWIATASGRCNCLPTVTTACARAGFTPRYAIEADEFATTVGFVAAGLGIALVPMLALSSLPDDVVSRRLRDAPGRHVYAVTRKEASHPMIAVLLDALRLSAGSFVLEAA